MQDDWSLKLLLNAYVCVCVCAPSTTVKGGYLHFRSQLPFSKDDLDLRCWQVWTHDHVDDLVGILDCKYSAHFTFARGHGACD